MLGNTAQLYWNKFPYQPEKLQHHDRSQKRKKQLSETYFHGWFVWSFCTRRHTMTSPNQNTTSRFSLWILSVLAVVIPARWIQRQRPLKRKKDGVLIKAGRWSLERKKKCFSDFFLLNGSFLFSFSNLFYMEADVLTSGMLKRQFGVSSQTW